ncbi:MAG: AbrB/MazE/SpoVT family DNA-binding domain-containing protein [Candidatus Bathyarchaeia archaeon]
MPELEIDFVKIQLRKSGSYMVTIPKKIVESLGLRGGDTLKVLMDPEKRRIIYQRISE